MAESLMNAPRRLLLCPASAWHRPHRAGKPHRQCACQRRVRRHRRHRRFAGPRLSRQTASGLWRCRRWWRATRAFPDLQTDNGVAADEAFLSRASRSAACRLSGCSARRRHHRSFSVRSPADAVRVASASRGHREGASRPKLFSSVRDILQQNRKAGRDEETVALVRDHFDGVLVHGDPRLRAFGRYPSADMPKIATKIRYTGMVAAARAADPEETFRYGRIRCWRSGRPRSASSGQQQPPPCCRRIWRVAAYQRAEPSRGRFWPGLPNARPPNVTPRPLPQGFPRLRGARVSSRRRVTIPLAICCRRIARAILILCRW